MQRRFWLAGGAILAALVVLAAVAPRASAYRALAGHGFGPARAFAGQGLGPGRHAFGAQVLKDPEAAKQHVGMAVEWALRGVDATEDQKQKARQITDRLIDELAPEIQKHRDFREAMARELARPEIDRAALERLRRLAAEPFAAVLLDVMLPDTDGFEVCRPIRSGSDVPVLMLTARGQDEDRIVGLELGADDYLPKPFNPRDLLARLRAVMRRGKGPASRSAPLRFGRLEIDRDARAVRVDGEERALTGYQFDLLVALAEAAGRVRGRETLMARAGHDAAPAFDRSVDVHVSRIRAAIEDDAKKPRRLLTVRGAGYVFARKQDED